MTVWLSENMYLFLSKNIRNYIYVFLNKNKDKKNLVDWKAVPVFLMHYLFCANYCSSQRVPRASAGLSSFQGLPRISKFTSRDFSSVQHVNYTLNLRVLLFLWQWRRPYHFCEKIVLTLIGSQDAIYPLDTF